MNKIKSQYTDRLTRKDQIKKARKNMETGEDVHLSTEQVIDPYMLTKYDAKQKFGIDETKNTIQPSKIIAAAKDDIKLGHLMFRIKLPMKQSDLRAYYSNLGKPHIPADSIRVHFVLKKVLSEPEADKNGRSSETWKANRGKHIAITAERVKPEDLEEQIKAMAEVAKEIRKKFKSSIITVIPSVRAVSESQWSKKTEEKK